MINLTIDNIGAVKVPEDWSEITISKWIELDAILQKFKFTEDDTPLEQISKQAQLARNLFSCLSGLSLNQVDLVSSADVQAVVNMVLQEPEPKAISEFKFNGVTYCLPKTTKDLNDKIAYGDDMTFGRYVDAKQFEFIFQQIESGNIRKIPYMISHMSTPKGGEWSSSAAKKLGKEFEQLPVTTAVNCAFFLSSLMRSSLKALAAYFQAVKQAANQMPKQGSTDGNHFTTNLRIV